ncbi:MAG: CrcB family protein [Elusimicrobiota bacterium]|nr:CrcB family protein [Elusimicrobiota bacterium]
MSRLTVLGLAAGSLTGGFARYALAGVMARAAVGGLPWGILTVNLAGCLLAGLVDGLAGRLSPEARVALLSGFCGAFTTFSALMLDASGLLRAGQGALAFVYVALSAAAGLACVRLGGLIAGRF